jgi:hypothetical protein
MSGRPSRESIMTALLNALVASVKMSFTADTQANSVQLNNPSSLTGLFVGLPVFAANIPRGAIITNLTPLTISLPATTNEIGVAMTTGFLQFGRRLIHWTQVAEQPALFLRDGDEEMEYANIILQRQTLMCEIWIYSNAGADPTAVPATALNNLLDAVQSVFNPDDRMRNVFRLGGLVEWCRIAGKIMKEPGDMDGQAIAIVDVEITVP